MLEGRCGFPWAETEQSVLGRGGRPQKGLGAGQEARSPMEESAEAFNTKSQNLSLNWGK